jgi:hypothetical protein
MSYALHIWEKPADMPWPRSHREAAELLRALHDAKRAQNPKFLVLAQNLTKRYPCITSSSAEEIPEDELAWSDGPLDGRTDSAVYSVGVRSARWEEVRAFLVEQARALGLNVTDDAAEEVFLANGVRLGLAGRDGAPSKPTYDDVPRARDLSPMVFERLMPLMQKHDFKPQKGQREFKRSFPGGWHFLFFDVQDHWPVECDIGVTVRSRFDVVTDLIAAIAMPEKSKAEVRRIPTTVLGQQAWIGEPGGYVQGVNRQLVVRSYRDVEGALGQLSSKLENTLLPVLHEYETIEGLDRLLNTDPVSSSPFFSSYSNGAKNVVTAFLAKNPRLGALCELFLANTQGKGGYPQLIAVLHKCIEHVRGRALA